MPSRKPTKAETGQKLNSRWSNGTSPSLPKELDIAEMVIGAAVLSIVQRKRRRRDGSSRARKNP
jgi:hypothetical protein